MSPEDIEADNRVHKRQPDTCNAKASLFTGKEIIVLNTLAKTWELFLELPVLHLDDRLAFSAIIHAAQDMILTRPGLRDLYRPDGRHPAAAVRRKMERIKEPK
jgi:hypothetical protein